jgi:hypothetical protein
MPVLHECRALLARGAAIVAMLSTVSPLDAQRSDSTRSREPWTSAAGRDTSRLLYQGLGYGSDAYNTPLTVLLNKGYDVFQLRRNKRDFWTFDYGRAWQFAVADVVREPDRLIRKFGGWNRFSRIELYPSSRNVDEWNWLVNYTEHLVGGGVTMRMLDEWYRAHRVPLPRTMAVLTTYAASILNEVTEQQTYYDATAGGVADLLIFDVAAVALFHWKEPTAFLARTLQVADWSNQASLTFPNRQLQNNGQYITLKVPVGLDRTRLFIRGGMGVQFGIARKLDDVHHLSVGVGGDTEVRDIDPTGHETVEFAPSVGVYYDRANSLLWSVTSSPAENVLTVNVYPGVLKGAMGEMGLWTVVTRHRELRFGVVHRRALGLGVGYGR